MQNSLDDLLRRLGSRRYETWKPASAALSQFGVAAIEPLVRLMTHGETDIQAKAVYVLQAMNDVRVLAWLPFLLHDESAAVSADALRILRALGENDGSLLARKILVQPDLAATQRFEILTILQQIVPRDWNTKLRFPLGSLSLFCRQMARAEDQSLQTGAKAVLDYMSLPRASQRVVPFTPREMLRAAPAHAADTPKTLLRSVNRSPEEEN